MASLSLPELNIDRFPDFFNAIHGHSPFRWQTRLAEIACNGNWSDFIKLPTSSGKTACIDIAVFSLAYQASRQKYTGKGITAPRRIFFVVDRRVIVNEAFQRATKICDQLEKVYHQRDVANPALPVAAWLQSLTDHPKAPPLDCFELRGGIYRDDAWVRSMLQPTILTSTVDQIGSRLLFRGYGVSDTNLSIHAALTANDSLVILDEAHCSKPFSQTLEAIARYRDANLNSDIAPRWSEQSVASPFGFTQMTATPDAPAQNTTVFELEPDDYNVDPLLKQRHYCSKPVRLVECNAKGAQQNAKLAKELVTQAKLLASPPEGSIDKPCRRIAIVVNRVACAHEAYRLLQKEFGDQVDLMIGRMRPFDRDVLTEKLQKAFRSDPNRAEDNASSPRFVVATQCLEVGADFDFDGLVSQCAALDALRQRFGRLNRLGLPGQSHSRGVIVMATGDLKPKEPDPIYGEALPNTWQWLSKCSQQSPNAAGPEVAGDRANETKARESDITGTAMTTSVDFGITAMDAMIGQPRTNPQIPKLSAESLNAPVLMAAHLDILCQTAPKPAIEPDIATFLHGPNRGVPELRVCWRADLPEKSDALKDEHWANEARKTVAVCPPSAAELISVPLARFRNWLNGVEPADETGDVLGEHSENGESIESEKQDLPRHRYGIVWTGADRSSVFVDATTIRNLRPNDTIVLPVRAGGWSQFGHVPKAPNDIDAAEVISDDRYKELAKMDIADCAFQQSRARIILRVHKRLISSSADAECFRALLPWVDSEKNGRCCEILASKVEDQVESPDTEQPDESSGITARHSELLKLCQSDRKSSIQMFRYTDGLAFVGPRDSGNTTHRRQLPRASFGDDFDEQNTNADGRLPLVDHLQDVAEETQRLVAATSLKEGLARALVAAAERHDLGKADPRFQAMLLNSSLTMAHMQPKLWAKSAQGAATRQAGGLNDLHGLPNGFRHEMLSVQLAERIACDLDEDQQTLMLHAIAAHHGHARPFAPVVIDESPVTVSLRKLGDVANAISLTSNERRNVISPHRLDSGIAERFWKLNRRFGWWGLAWLESTLRLADWIASTAPREQPRTAIFKPVEDDTRATNTAYELSCPGIDAANPLGFLSALGLLRSASHALPDINVRMRWQHNGRWHPVLVLSQPMSADELIKELHHTLSGHQTDRHFCDLGQNTTVPKHIFRTVTQASVAVATRQDRTSIDFYAAFGSDALVSENGITIQDTALRTMAGAGHQHFLETMRNVIACCEPEHIERTVFQTWQYNDPTQTLSLRFDPLDDNRYALRWRNPSGDPDRKNNGSMLGANRLAIEAIPFFTTAPGARFLQTVGFTGQRSRDTYFSWPVWTPPIEIDAIRSLLALREVQFPKEGESLVSRGVAAVFRSQRITVGKLRNFTPASTNRPVASRSDQQQHLLH
jgi:CRISPR-associated endonuclease/helicase Cas3